VGTLLFPLPAIAVTWCACGLVLSSPGVELRFSGILTHTVDRLQGQTPLSDVAPTTTGTIAVPEVLPVSFRFLQIHEATACRGGARPRPEAQRLDKYCVPAMQKGGRRANLEGPLLRIYPVKSVAVCPAVTDRPGGTSTCLSGQGGLQTASVL